MSVWVSGFVSGCVCEFVSECVGVCKERERVCVCERERVCM